MITDFYAPGDSWLHRLDGRVKLLLAVCLMVVLLATSNLFVVLGALVAVHLMLASARVPVARLVWAWRMMIPVLVMIVVLWPLFSPGAPGAVLVALGPVRVTTQALLTGVMMALRITGMGFACFTMLFTTDQTAIVRAMVQLGLPYRFGLMVASALRYLPTFFSLIDTVTDAQRARGLELSGRNLFRRMSQYLPILVAVVISSLKMSDNLSNALESRAFGVRGRQRTYLHEARLAPVDVLVGGVLVVGTGAYLVAYAVSGFGTQLLGV